MTTNSECLFCQIASKEQDAEIVGESEKTISFLDANPSSPGHTMVIPKSHSPTLLDFDKEELAVLFEEVKKTVTQLQKTLSPDGFTIGINQDKAGGQHVPHLHVHIIPRFEGDKGGPIQAVVRNQPEEEISTIAGKIRGAAPKKSSKGHKKDFVKKKILQSEHQYKGVRFMSEGEAVCAALLDKYKIISEPKFGKNCHLFSGSKEIDFYPRYGVFIEYHPCETEHDPRTRSQYLFDRKRLIEKKGFEGHKLILIENFDEFYEKVLPFFEIEETKEEFERKLQEAKSRVRNKEKESKYLEEKDLGYTEEEIKTLKEKLKRMKIPK